MLSVLELYGEYEKRTSQNFLWNINIYELFLKVIEFTSFAHKQKSIAILLLHDKTY